MLAFAAPALGWTLLDYEAEVDQSTVGSQIRDGLPIYIGVDPMPTCGECAHFRAGSGHLGRLWSARPPSRSRHPLLRVVRRAVAVHVALRGWS